MVFSTIRGTTVEISESLFATTFDLPTEGLTDLSDVPKNLVFDARSLFSESKEQVSISCLKKELKIQYRLLHDILAKTLFVKAGSFDAVTRDRFLLMTAITFDVKVNWGSLLFGVLKAMVTPGSRQAKGFAIQIGVLLQNVHGLVLGESKGFPKSRILDAKTVHRFVHINEKVGLDESAASPRVKKTPVKKEVYKKRQAVGLEDAPVVKKKRTTKGKPVVIAQEAVPPKIDDATTDAPVEQLSMPKRKSQKRKRKLVLEDAIEVDEPVPAIVEQPAVVPVVEGTTEDPDVVIEQILHQLDTFGATDAEGFVGSSSDTDEELIADQPTVHLFPDAGDQPHVSETVAKGTTDDELLSIEEHQARIPFNASLPSTLAPTITPIRFGQGIEFREVDAYKDSLPQIDASDKGKEILVEDDVQGHPAWEIFSLIFADIEFLIALREKVIEDVSIVVSFFSLHKLATLQSEDILAKEGQVLSWAETDSSAKYRELLLRKFIEARRKNFVSGTPTSAIDLKVLKLLGAADLFALKVLLRHMREHQLEWTRPSSSSLFEGPVIDRGFFIPPNHHSITSKCWIRAKIMVDGSWLILEGVDYWRPINTPPSLSRAVSIVWAEICMEAVQFSLLGSVRPVGSVNFCRDLVVRGSVVEVLETLPIHFRRIIRKGIDCNSSVDSVVQSDSEEIQEVDVQVHLSEDDIPLEENVNVQTTFPTATGTADLSPLLDDLKTSLSQRMDNAHSDILSRLHTIDRGLQNTPGHQNDYFRNLIQSARQEGQNKDDLQILRLNELKKTVMAQDVTTDTDSLAVRNRFNALDAKILLLDGQVTAIRSEQLEFQEKMAADLLILSTQIGDLFDYIRGGDAKKGEGISSRHPLPTPVNQGESSGNVIRTTEIISPTDIDAAQRDIMERMMRADRERDRERRERRLSRSGSYKRGKGY
ncbi:hypothetical protein F511_41716 [Dorcoceras hygrometricum]|uniref:Uncharacterized protein n=1 Tax=Dorcoceras hygrometricum TaxID=472368 RepID=A0A2Z7AJV9_9LAMI|nr:hypothetical protein F511_41716 [Dorcoceras hygrometricum]